MSKDIKKITEFLRCLRITHVIYLLFLWDVMVIFCVCAVVVKKNENLIAL